MSVYTGQLGVIRSRFGAFQLGGLVDVVLPVLPVVAVIDGSTWFSQKLGLIWSSRGSSVT